MFITIKGHFENGQIIPDEPSPFQEKTEVLITFLVDTAKRQVGALDGKIIVSEDDDEPVDDFDD